MENRPSSLKEIALQYLRDAVDDPNAQFRNGQWESIQELINENRVLVVQATGWGKTMVYMIATKILRSRGKGLSLMVSPLLALMRNQCEAAKTVGLNAVMLSGDVAKNLNELHAQITKNRVDILMVTPERLATVDFEYETLPVLAKHAIGMLIIDEAHCLSDWGHDFRPDFQRIRRIQERIPRNSAIVATTATANDRVVGDVREQLGRDIQIHRGNLVRKSLLLYRIPDMPGSAERLGWIYQAIIQGLIQGSGIIYALTHKDVSLVADWLVHKGLNAAAYYGKEDRKIELETALQNNNLDVLVSTVALGMGFDKPDLSFVLHFQRPPSVVHYYQQVGRAGRRLDDAHGILLRGEEDEQITDFFMDNAFPDQSEIDAVMELLDDAEDGLRLKDILAQVNLPQDLVKKILKLASLESPAPVTQERDWKWYAQADILDFKIPPERIARIKNARQRDRVQMQEYMRHTDCLMEFLQRALDDPHARPCGRCQICLGASVPEPQRDLIREAEVFMEKRTFRIPAKKRWPYNEISSHPIHNLLTIPTGYMLETGLAFRQAFDGGQGDDIWNARKSALYFPDVVIQGFVHALHDQVREYGVKYVTFVPPHSGTRHVPHLAEKVASLLGLRLVEAIGRNGTAKPQRTRRNAIQRAMNVAEEFKVIDPVSEPVLLLDGLTHTGWTLQTAGALLRYHGCPLVFPATLLTRNLYAWGAE